MDSSRHPAPPPFPVLETKRLLLREITLGDVGFWLRNFSDPAVVELTAYEPPADLEAAKAELIQYAARPFEQGTGIRWGISLRPGPDLIGTLGYHQWVKEGGNHARVGYELTAEHRRRGIMTEAMQAILAYGFESMKLNRVEALIDPRNVASIGLVEDLGFRRDGVLRENTAFRGRFFDDAVYSLLAREWRSSSEAKR
jgi:ribosomal-protein-alanine N-acetyltransferase